MFKRHSDRFFHCPLVLKLANSAAGVETKAETRKTLPVIPCKSMTGPFGWLPVGNVNEVVIPGSFNCAEFKSFYP